jgi:TonB-dependent SusC/RagA subfamily outer membrane receptor
MKTLIAAIVLLLSVSVAAAQDTATQRKKEAGTALKNTPLYVVNGKEIIPSSVNDLNPNDIESINVLKDGSAIKKYGGKGINGVVEINLKKEAIERESKKIQQKTNPPVFTKGDSTALKNTPLYVLNGKEIISSSLNNLNPDDIESVNVLKDESAIKKYGSKGSNGVVEINLKKEAVERESKKIPKN